MKERITIIALLGLVFLSAKIQAQEKDISAKIDFIGVSFGYKTYSTSLP